MKYLVVLFSVALFAFGCKSTEDQSSNSDETHVEAEHLATDEADYTPAKQDELELNRNEHDSLVFKLERGACYGDCPVYLVQIFKSGHAVLNAQQNLDIQGFYEDSFSQEELNMIFTQAENAGFFEGESVYDANVTDLPASFLYIHLNGKKHKMKLRFNIPEEFMELLKEYEAMILERDWQQLK